MARRRCARSASSPSATRTRFTTGPKTSSRLRRSPASNDSDFGLTASVWTRDLTQALNYTDRLQAGTVWVNSHTLIDANLPFGGMKQSGTGRDFGPDWLDGWCETKSVCVRY